MRQNFTYKIINKPTNLIFTLEEIKNYLKIDADITSDDNLIISMYWAAYNFFESYTNRTLLNTQYLTFRDCFFINSCSYNMNLTGYYELRKSQLQSVDKFQYYNTDGVLIDVESDVYYNTLENDYSKILLVDGKQFSNDIQKRMQAIQITFTAGYGTTIDDIPFDIRDALLSMIANLYEDRGDCYSGGLCSCSLSMFDGVVKSVLQRYKIYNI